MALNNGLNDPTTTTGDIIYRDSTGKTTKLPVGTDKEVLKINGTNIEWQPEGDENSVKLTGDQTIAGVKTFTSSPVVPAPTTNFQAATKKYVDDNATSGYVDITTAQSIGGVKTFTSSPVVPAPTTNFQAATKKYVDDNKITDYVKLTTNQSVAGIKTFTSSPVVPAPTTDLQAATKKYVDESITEPLQGTFDGMTYENKSFDCSAFSSAPSQIVLSTDGTKMFIYDITDQYIYEITLSTPFDVSTASYSSASLNAKTGSETNTKCFCVSNDGKHIYVYGYDYMYVVQFDLSTAWDLSTASDSGKKVTGMPKTLYGIAMNNDGTALYTSIGTDLKLYTLSTPYDISTATTTGSVPTINTYINTNQLDVRQMSSDNSKDDIMYMCNTAGRIIEYGMSGKTGWSFYNKVPVINSYDQATTSKGGCANNSQGKAYIVAYFVKTIYQYSR